MRIVVEPDSNGFGTTVFVEAEDQKRFDTGEQFTGVKIVTAYGISTMSYDQWKTMLALGISMLMQEGANSV